jgi:hypothetical protein
MINGIRSPTFTLVYDWARNVLKNVGSGGWRHEGRRDEGRRDEGMGPDPKGSGPMPLAMLFQEDDTF